MPVRLARPADREACLALWARLQDEHEALDDRLRRSESAAARWSNDFAAWTRSEGSAVFVVDEAETVVGLATAHAMWPPPVYEQRLTVFVAELVVVPESRGHGHGRALLDAVTAWAGSIGAEAVEAGVLARNADARAFWEAAGAEPYSVTYRVEVGK